MPISPKWSLLLRFPDYISLLISHFHYASYMSLICTFICLITVRVLGEKYKF
jgi:hypothetical protein